MILGRGEAGKSALAQDLSRRIGVPAAELDALFWRPGPNGPIPAEPAAWTPGNANWSGAASGSSTGISALTTVTWLPPAHPIQLRPVAIRAARSAAGMTAAPGSPASGAMPAVTVSRRAAASCPGPGRAAPLA